MIPKEALLEKVRDRLRTELADFTEAYHGIRIMVGERVPPGAGEEFISVRSGIVRNLYPADSVTKQLEHSVIIGITRRLEGIANEQIGENIQTYDTLVRTKPSMEARASEIATEIDGNWTLMRAVNNAITGGGCFLTALGLVAQDAEPETKGSSHFDQEFNVQGQDDFEPRDVALYMELEFRARYFLVR